MNKLKNLALVDDDEIFVFLTRKTIEKTNLVDQVKVFNNGLEAMYFLNENSNTPEQLPDIILLDLSMPVMDGWQFLEAYINIKPRIGKQIIVCIVSSPIAPEDLLRAKSISEVTDFIIKPITKDQMVEMLTAI